MQDDPLIPGPVPLRPEFRDRMRAETARLVHRHSSAPRVWGAVLAASLLVASLTAWWLLSRPAEPQMVERNKSVEHEPEPAPITPVAPTSPLAPAVALEWKAFDDRTPERAKLYLAAGDRYAHDHQDLASALRCYEEALDLGGPYVEVSLDDSWLVMALKLDRQKEK